MIHDLKSKVSVSGEIRVCYLAEESAHITSPTFKVYIPDIMGGIDPEQQDYQIDNDDTFIMNGEKAEFGGSMQCQAYLVARSACPYGHRIDGWIPKCTVEKIEHTDGTASEISAQSSKGKTDGVPQHPPHPISQKFMMFTNKLKSIIFNKSTFTSVKGVDLQNINNKVIKKGHKMYGAFVVGEQNQFVVFAIDNAVPYMAGTDIREDADNPDNSFDGGSSNVPNS